MYRVLEGFHHRIARRIAGLRATLLPNGEWEYPDVSEALRIAGLHTIREHISRRLNKTAEYVATRPIFNLCINAEAQTGAAPNRTWWWEQEFGAQDADVDQVV